MTEIIKSLKTKIGEFENGIDITEFGNVVSSSDGIAKVSGLSGVMASEMLDFPNGIKGLALNLGEDTVGAVILGNYLGIKEGDVVKIDLGVHIDGYIALVGHTVVC